MQFDILRAKRALGYTVAALICLTLSACLQSDAVPGKITIRNDIRDKSYNTIKVDNVRTAAGRSFRSTIKSGTAVTIPFKRVRSFRLSRRYQKYTQYYVVECPEKQPGGIVVKMIDVHVNRIAGGCTTVQAYKR